MESSAQPETVAKLIDSQLRVLEKTHAELAEAIDLPTQYVDDLLAGRRPAPSPGQADLYKKMTKFLKLGRTDLTACAEAQRARTKVKRLLPKPKMLNALMGLCSPETAQGLEQRLASEGKDELVDLLGRVLDVTKASVRSTLSEATSVKSEAKRSGIPYADLRLRILNFLESTPDTLTAEEVSEFLVPKIDYWTVDLETGALRVVLKPQEVKERPRHR